MTGTIALLGGGPFAADDELDRRLLADAGADVVVVLPTADAFEMPHDMAAAAVQWGERLSVEVRPLMVLRRSEALDAANAAALAGVRAVWLVGDSPLHLRSVMKDTPLWDAVRAVAEGGGVVAGVGQCAAALCDPMTDPRGGAFTLGLGLLAGMACLAEADTQSADRLQRTLKLADVPVVVLPTGSAALHRAGGWEMVGDVEVHGTLPA